MLYAFPTDTLVVAISDYQRLYEDPISAKAGDTIIPVTDGSKETDVMGWTWCIGHDGRVGWTPDSWCELTDGGWRLMRDFSAFELTVKKGDRLRLLYSESGFLLCETLDGEQGWVPDAAVALEASS